MRRILVAALAATFLASPLLVEARDHDRDRGSRHERGGHRDHDRHARGHHDDKRKHHRDHDRRWNDRHVHRHVHRHVDVHRHVEVHRHARYRVGHYHRPAGYRAYAWHRGARLPAAYCAPRYIVHDYRAYDLYRPPHGHHWVRVDGDVVLAAIATGAVVAVVNNLFY